jgi:hypothetical protein
VTSDDEDVKALLGRALTGEPPLTLDRDEVFRQGRRGLRNRRFASAGGAIAGAVVAVVGAVVLTNLVAEDPAPETPPAATRTERPAPPGPTLPLTTTHDAPPTSHAAPSPDYAGTLTGALLGALPADARPSRLDGTPPTFTAARDTYEFEADIETGTADGSLSVSVGSADPAVVADCKQVTDANAGCAVRKARGILVAVGKWKDYGTGEKRYIAYTVRKDGTSVTAIATNLSERRRKYHKAPADTVPVVDEERLAEIVTQPGLRFG